MLINNSAAKKYGKILKLKTEAIFPNKGGITRKPAFPLAI